MLSRATSDAGTRLRRSKSTSTVQSYKTPGPEPLDPDVAQKHALAAATAAFVRAQTADAPGRTKSRSTELSRTKSSATRKSQGSHFPQPLQRESSLRSAQPHKTAKVLGVPRQPHVTTTATEKFPPFHATPGTSKTMSTQPSVSSNENVRPNSQPKAQRPSASSSITSQQIRKARSMYYASSIQTGSPIPRPAAKYLTTPPVSSVPDNPLLSVHNTDSFVLLSRSIDGQLQRSRTSAVSPLAAPRLPMTVGPGETVDNARDKCLQDFQQQRQVRHKPSLFLAPFKKRQDKSKRKGPVSSSGRMSSGSHMPTDAALDVALPEFKPIKEKRSISDSLRNKFKKVFRRSSNKTTAVPVQQIDAARDYYSDCANVQSLSAVLPHTDVPSPDPDTLHRIRTRSPSLETGRPALARPSSRGSNRSLHSEASLSNPTTSRVTSWCNSSDGDTLTQRAMKRLTVIHEAKDSIGSEAGFRGLPTSPQRKPPPIPAFAAFRDPMPMDGFPEETLTPVDPKRVFSALMKEIDATENTQGHTAHLSTTPQEENDVFTSSATRDLRLSASRDQHSRLSRDYWVSASSDGQRPSSALRPDSLSAESRSGSIRSNSLKSLGRALKATIRTVTPSGQPATSFPTPPTPDRASGVRGAIRIPRPASDRSPASIISEEVDNCGEGDTLASFDFRLRPRGDVRPNNVALEERDSPSSPVTKADTFKMAENAHTRSVYESFQTSRLVREPTEGQYGLPLPRSPKSRQVFSPMSPSVYSRNTDGMSILPNDSIASLDCAVEDTPVPGTVSGSAVIITSHSVKSYVIGTPTRQRVASSARSSRDWKAWLSHEVSELANLPDEEITIHDQYNTAHRREFTQISEEEDTVLIHEVEDTPTPSKEPVEVETPTMARKTVETSAVRAGSSEPKFSVASLPTVSSSSPLPQPIPRPKQRRVSSNQSVRSSLSRPKLERTSISERMNDRFPFIDKGRRSSSNSASFSRHTPSIGGSHSSSSKASSSPKLYSDFSAPPSLWPSKHDPNLRVMRGEVHGGDKENRKDKATPSSPFKKVSLGLPGSPTSQSLDRPKSMQPRTHSSLNRATSSLSQYTTSVEDLKGKQTASGTAVSPRIRVRVRPVSPAKLTARPKSAFDLRNANTPSLTPGIIPQVPGSHSPRRNKRYQGGPVSPKKLGTGRAVEGDTLRMVLGSSPGTRGSPSLRSSPRTSATDLRRPLRHVKTSSSTLALNKEPSPGAESLGIDCVLDDEDPKECLASRGGSVTPGQRMAERFLRERTAGSGAGSPVLGYAGNRSVTGSPAFV